MKNLKPLAVVFLVITLLLTNKSAFGYEPEQAKANQAHELANCAAFFAVMYQCALNTKPDDPLANKMMGLSEDALALSIALSNEKVANARLILEIQTLGEEMDNSCSNTSIAILKHREICEEALSSPENRTLYWLEKED